jgi:CBS domain-containing protein
MDEMVDMGNQQSFMDSVLDDLRALRQMLEQGRIGSGPPRIGIEQELFLVDDSWQPAPVGPRILEDNRNPHVTHELGRFNLEINFDPLEFRDGCLEETERQLNSSIEELAVLARAHGARILLAGILPTLTLSQLTNRNMSPQQRYHTLSEAITKLRGETHSLRIRGIDELMVKVRTIMLEACNTSFQVHLQVPPDQFPRYYNIAQLATAPVLAAAVNSPLLLSKRLWKETRIALFQLSVDTRRPSTYPRSSRSRVGFGDRWVRDSVLDIFREDVTRFRALMKVEGTEDPFEALSRNRLPRLKALSLFNGTVYRWNRPCYGVHQGRAHLRIENRVLPAGPSVLDEVANAAFFCGLVTGLAQEHGDVTPRISFAEVKSNFLSAARSGLNAQLNWLDGGSMSAPELIRERLLPVAREGLRHRGIRGEDIKRYLGVIEKRVENGQTGADWLLRSYSRMGGDRRRGEILVALTAATYHRQTQGRPVHSWPLAQADEGGDWRAHYQRIEQYMTTEVFTVQPEDPIDLAASIMDWERVRHIPVEDEQNRLVGLVSYRAIFSFFIRQGGAQRKMEPVRRIMKPDPITVTPETLTVDAIALMRRERIGCLPVVQDDRLVGIVTYRDFMGIAGHVLEQQLRAGDQGQD